MGRVWVVLRCAKAVGEVVLLAVAVLKWRRAFEASFLPGQKMSRLFRLLFFENGYELKLVLSPVVGAH